MTQFSMALEMVKLENTYDYTLLCRSANEKPLVVSKYFVRVVELLQSINPN